jgi:hypothetical protein
LDEARESWVVDITLLANPALASKTIRYLPDQFDMGLFLGGIQFNPLYKPAD